jgi:hypothetical protein
MGRIICDRSLLDLPKGIHQEVIRSNFAELESNKYDAGLYAFHQALLRIQESTLHDFVVYSDSISSLESIEQLYPT